MENLHEKGTFQLHNKVEIPRVGFGTWQVPDGETAADAVIHAIEAGYTHIDTATVYHNEIGVGAGIRMSGAPREKLFVTSKLWNAVRGYEETLKAFDASLKRLDLEYLDLYLIHWPRPLAFRDTCQEANRETWRATMALEDWLALYEAADRKNQENVGKEVANDGTAKTGLGGAVDLSEQGGSGGGGGRHRQDRTKLFE